MKYRFSCLFLTLAALTATASAQNFRHMGVEFEARREVRLAADARPEVAVVEFYHHGLINKDGTNVAVIESRGGKPVPARVLQLGPGDFSRIAFEPAENRAEYELFYGGSALKPDELPEWTRTSGLLLETRAFRHCNLNQWESVKEAFEAAEPIGAGYVEGVMHGSNPFAPGKGPFLSRYSGMLHIDKGGETHFWTASRDASFLVIDGKVVVAAPGRHGPLRQAQPGASGKADLSPGAHRFEYYHAAAGPEAMMAAAWLRGPLGDKPRPTAIDPAAFRVSSVASVEAGPPMLAGRRPIPDFRFQVVGDCPLPDEPDPLIGVAFENRTPESLTLKAKIRWDFGDGQSSEEPSPAHVYLTPGLYTVTLSITRGLRTLEMTNRIEVARPFYLDRTGKDPRTKQHKIDDYLPVLDRYDPAALSVPHVKRLVFAYLWKAETIVSANGNPPKQDDSEDESEDVETAQNAQTRFQRALAERRAAALPFIERAVQVGRAPFEGKDTAKPRHPKDLHALAVEVGTLARERLGDARAAYDVLRRATMLLAEDRPAAVDCATRAADIAVNDLLTFTDAKALFDSTEKRNGALDAGEIEPRLLRVLGDYHASLGKSEEARAAYRRAAESRKNSRRQIETAAWSGAYGRSTDQFLRSGQWDRAMSVLQAWQDEFPAEKLDGYWHSRFIRYWIGREKYDQAVAQAEQLLAVNPTSAYADEAVWLAARSEYLRGKKDRAEATLHSLIEDYPGSPLVPDARAALEMLQRGEWDSPESELY